MGNLVIFLFEVAENGEGEIAAGQHETQEVFERARRSPPAARIIASL